MRNNNYGRRSNKSWAPEFSTKGQMDFTVNGFVQEIKEGDGVDYVAFKIDNPYVQNNINTIDVEVNWEGFPQLEKGDHVNIFGMIRSWWNSDIKRVTYSFIAEQVEVIKDEEPKAKTRRGTAKPVLEDEK
jgi:hypothetical protein